MGSIVDLNADVGEERGDDARLLEVVSSANVATGAHAGGGPVLLETVRLAASAGCAVGAHPSFRDLEGFGRRPRFTVEPADALIEDLAGQIVAVADACARFGVPLAHVKAHGALYNDAAVSSETAELLVAAVAEARRRLNVEDLPILGPPSSVLQSVVQGTAGTFITEGFADRAYESDGSLVPRSRPGAVHQTSARICDQAVGIVVDNHVTSVDGVAVDLVVDSLCLHGDTPGALGHAIAVREALEDRGVRIRACGGAQ